jgi:hypothetical protein
MRRSSVQEGRLWSAKIEKRSEKETWSSGVGEYFFFGWRVPAHRAVSGGRHSEGDRNAKVKVSVKLAQIAAFYWLVYFVCKKDGMGSICMRNVIG